MGNRAVIDVNSVILSKCHNGESLFEYYLQEFQYGREAVQTTTSKVSILVNDSKVRRGIESNL